MAVAYPVMKNEERDKLDSSSSLESRILVLQQDITSHLYRKGQEFHSTVHLFENYETELKDASKMKGKELSNQIKKIKKCVVDFSDMLHELKPEQTSVEKLKHTMEEIEASIISFRRCHSEEFEQLLQEEKVLMQEILAFDNKLESWLIACSPVAQKAAVVAASTSNAAVGSPHKLESGTPDPVLVFEKFLWQNGGHQGGWDNYDHQIFVRLRNRCSDLSTLLRTAAIELPTKTLSDIEQHEQWYVEYCTLLKSKKEAIQTWRRQKQYDRNNCVNVEAKRGNLLGSKKQHKQEELFAKERKERFAKLLAWKHEKESERMKVKEDSLQDAKWDEEKERRRRIVKKKQVDEYIKSKEEGEKLKRLEIKVERTKERERRRAATKKVAEYRERDIMKFLKRQERFKEKESQKYWKEKQLEKLKEKVQVTAVRDPARLLKPTASSRERVKEGLGSGLGGPVLVMPRRAVPSWRRT